MRRKFTDGFLDDAVRLYNEGLTLKAIGERLSCSPDNLSKAMRGRGVDTTAGRHRPACNRKNLDVEDIVAAHLGGASVQQIARHHGVDRITIRRRLVEQGVQPRGRSDAMYTRMAALAPEQRKQLASAAHEAIRGVKRPRHVLLAAAAQRESGGRKVNIGPGEEIFTRFLSDRGIEYRFQAACDIYNIDILVGSVAVELTGCPNRYRARPDFARRTEQIISSGRKVLYVDFRPVDCLTHCLEDVLATINKVEGLPAVKGEYRVIRCSVKRFTRGRDKRGQFTAKMAPVKYISRLRRYNY